MRPSPPVGRYQAQDFINLYAPECREGVDASDVAEVIGFIRLFVPGLSELDVEGVDPGRLSLQQADKGVLVDYRPKRGTPQG